MFNVWEQSVKYEGPIVPCQKLSMSFLRLRCGCYDFLSRSFQSQYYVVLGVIMSFLPLIKPYGFYELLCRSYELLFRSYEHVPTSVVLSFLPVFVCYWLK